MSADYYVRLEQGRLYNVSAEILDAVARVLCLTEAELHVARHPDDPRMAALVEELTARSPEFRQWWPGHPVWAEPHGRHGFWHPDVGEFTLSYEAFVLPDMPDSNVVVYAAAPGSPGRAALDALERREDPR